MAVKTFKSSIAEIDNMPLDFLLDLINVYEKINSTDNKRKVYIDEIL